MLIGKPPIEQTGMCYLNPSSHESVPSSRWSDVSSDGHRESVRRAKCSRTRGMERVGGLILMSNMIGTSSASSVPVWLYGSKLITNYNPDTPVAAGHLLLLFLYSLDQSWRLRLWFKHQRWLIESRSHHIKMAYEALALPPTDDLKFQGCITVYWLSSSIAHSSECVSWSTRRDLEQNAVCYLITSNSAAVYGWLRPPARFHVTFSILIGVLWRRWQVWELREVRLDDLQGFLVDGGLQHRSALAPPPCIRHLDTVLRRQHRQRPI